MANVAGNVIIGKPLVTGGVLTGPSGTALPTDTVEAPDPLIVAVGYVSDDGVTQAINTDSSDIKAWGGDTVRTVQTGHELTYKFTLIETNDLSLAVYYGDDNVSAGTAEIVKGDLPYKVWVIEVKDGDKRVRIVIPDGQVTDRGDITYKDDEAVAYEVTITCRADASGVKAYLYSE
jgi:hypothetical protein